MEYKFEGIDESGKIIKGKIQEESQWKAIKVLKASGITCITCKSREEADEPRVLSKISLKDLALLCRSLKNNLKSGIPIIASLKLAAKHMKKKNLVTTLKKLINHIQHGDSFSEGLSKFGESFPPIFISMITIGEESGNLEQVFTRLEVYFLGEDKRRKTLFNITLYPMIIFSVSLIGAFVIITKFMPAFFTNMNMEESQLPFITRFYMEMAKLFNELNYLLLVVILISMVAIYYLYKKFNLSESIEEFKYKNFITRGIYIKNFSCRFTMALQMILNCGIDMKSAFYLLERTEGSEYIKKRYEEAREQLEKGFVFSEVIENFQLFPEEFLESILLAEESGDLEGVLKQCNEIFEEELKSKIEVFIKLLEPALILLAGLFLLSIYVAILIPIYGAYTL